MELIGKAGSNTCQEDCRVEEGMGSGHLTHQLLFAVRRQGAAKGFRAFGTLVSLGPIMV